MAPPPLAHPLPSRPTQAVPPRPAVPLGGGLPVQPGAGVPLSLPSRPSFLPTAPIPPTHAGFAAQGPHPASAPSPRPLTPGGLSAAPSPGATYSRAIPTPLPASAEAASLPWPGVRPRLRPTEVTTTAQLIELGEGWTVRYRAWKAPAVLLDPQPDATPDSLDRLAWDPLAPASLYGASFASSRTSSTSTAKDDAAARPPTKKTKKGARTGSAFDELLAEELALSTPAPGGQPSPSLGAPLESPSLFPPPSGPSAPQGRIPAALKAAAAASATAAVGSPSPASASTPAPDGAEPSHTRRTGSDADPSRASSLHGRLSSLRTAAPADPLAAAQAALAQRARQARDEGRDRLALISWVGNVAVRLGGYKADKGKGKAREGDAPETGKRERTAEGEVTEEGVDGEGRTLWVFSVLRGGEAEGEAVLLDELAFEGLEPFASGDFTHASLFPSLYPAKSGSPTYVSPLSLPANAYPSALTLCDKLHAVPLIAQPPPAQTPLQAAYESFRSAIASLLLDEVVRQPVPTARCIRLGTSIVYLPKPSTSRFASAPTRPALQLSLRPLSIHRSSIQLHSTLAHLPLAILPAEMDAATKVRLAPLDVRATFLRPLRVTPARQAQLEAEWAPHLDSACGSAVEGERGAYVLCALDVPGEVQGERMEVVWPRALVLLDDDRAASRGTEPATGSTASDAGQAAEPSPEQTAAADAAPIAKCPPLHPSLRRPRTLHDGRLRTRLAGQLLRCHAPMRRRDSEGVPDGGSARVAPLKCRTGDVWRWMEEEEKRREEEKETAARVEEEKGKEREKEKEDEVALAATKDDEKSATAPVPAAAPINMRTPMSLGASSTEAPSPAELFSLQPAHAPPTSAPLPPTLSAHVQPHETLQGMEIDFEHGMYPSPAEPGMSTSIAPAPTAASAPMSTLETAFSEFDWGDGTFGTSGMGGGQGGDRGTGGSGGGFDDGMMLGLTDDDFSFFDAPTPAPVSTLVNSLALSMPPPIAPVPGDLHFSSTPVVSGMDAAFDLFASVSADLPGVTVAATAFSAESILASTTSPQFPQGPSPALPFSFGGFEPLTPNALELASGSPAAPAVQVAPFSPVILPSVTHTPASAALTPYTPHPASYTPGVVADLPLAATMPSFRGLAAFEPVAFDPAHAALDAKYDPRRGKFGLPSPDSDHEGRALVHPGAGKRARTWYETVCDPRIALAERLRRQRLGVSKPATLGTSGRKLAAASAPPSGTWLRRRLGAPPMLGLTHLEGGTPSTAQNTADEAESEQSSSDSDKEDAMDVDGPPRVGRDLREGQRDEAEDHVVDEALGAALLASTGLLKRCLEPASAPPAAAVTDAGKPDPARDLTYHVVTEHLMQHADLREATLAFSLPSKRSSTLISSQSLATVSTALSAVCGALSPSPLFADHTALAPVVQEEAPAFLLRAQQCVVETSRVAVDFWRPMGFEPLPGAKNVMAFIVYEDTGTDVHELVKEWFKAVGSTYEGLRLGSHTPGTVSASTNFAGIRDGLVPLPAGLLSTSQARDELKLLYTALSDTSKTVQNTVVYLVAPLAESPLAQTSPLAGIIHQVSKSRHRASAVNMVPCVVPWSSLVRPGPSMSTCSMAGRLARLAFSVYDQLYVPVERLRFPMPETFPSARPPPLAPLGPAVRLFPAPAINVAPSVPSTVQFALSWPPTALEVQHRHRLLQVCYGSRPLSGDSGQECLVVTTVDEKGESWKVAPRLIKIPTGAVADVQRVRLVWSFVKSLVDAVDVEWRVILCKLGEPTGLEAKTWDSLLKEYLAVVRRPILVTFACAELDPSIAVLPRHELARRGSAMSTVSEDSDVASSGGGADKAALFDPSPTIFTFTPAEPISLSSLPISPVASTYFFHMPRIPSHTHSTIDLGTPLDPASTSSYALHVFLSHASRTSSYKATLGELVGDVRRSFVELAALGHARWGTSGRLAWHVEATGLALALADQLS